MVAKAGTGIAGSMDHKPASAGPGATCYVCGGPFECSYAARAAPGGMAQACSKACAATPKWRANPFVKRSRKRRVDDTDAALELLRGLGWVCTPPGG